MARKQKPSITFASAVWDESDIGIKNDEYVEFDFSRDSLDLWEVSYNDLIPYLYMEAFDPKKLWTRHHLSEKIEKVINRWNAGGKISPMLLVLNGNGEKLEISSGNHRFSVFVAFVNQMGLNPTIPFLIGSSEKSWIQQNIKSAIYKRTIK